MAYELAVAEGNMTDLQLEFAKKFSLQNYVKTLTLEHRNSKEEILKLEESTRGQSDNLLWKLLRVNRDTASGCSSYCGNNNPAMQYGIKQEKILKEDKLIIDTVKDRIEKKLKKKIIEEVLDCGLFLSTIGLCSASPDAYFILENGELVVLEIKCPYNYRNESFKSVIQQLGSKRKRIAHTALKRVSHDPLIIHIEQRNNHYRQIQSQLYVTGAVMAVYLVKFSDKCDIHLVERNESYIKELADKERFRLNMIIKENNRNKKFTLEVHRLDSFKNSGYDEEIVKQLAKNGLYCWCGNVICFFCGQHFEINEKTIQQILNEHDNENCDKGDNCSMTNVYNKRYLNIFDRINNLNESQTLSLSEIRDLAKKGYYNDGNKFVLYCCGGEKLHSNECHKA
ncbi:alk-exo [Cryptophlebia leucotreta granulovirus]|uniref:Alk-exo n=1 Tax=Cryptophlebia leucotreta granulosis virus TaxID=35254 RepID=Q7T5H8_GVCL|nr:alk-exo [Cryptophlebia leucotreta granulovirus]AAQ21710.1 alk-exo [Cryptophlebia leucotreta granulovirus]